MKALIIDDEIPNLNGLRLQLEKYCPEIEEIRVADSAAEARRQLSSTSFDILFLDIKMPNENGFDLLESIENRNFSVVFVTAYSEYAIRAFKANAVDYLLKPVDSEELMQAVERCRTRTSTAWQLKELKSSLQSGAWPEKLTLPHQSGFHIIQTENIIWVEADGNYCTLHLTSGKPILVSKAIREFELILNPADFFRCHKSALINIKYISGYQSHDGHNAVMKNGHHVPVSRRKLDEFHIAIQSFSKKL